MGAVTTMRDRDTITSNFVTVKTRPLRSYMLVIDIYNFELRLRVALCYSSHKYTSVVYLCSDIIPLSQAV